MASVRPDEVSAILRQQLTGFEKEVDVYDVGTVLQVGDGVARVYGLSKAMAGELLEFPNEVYGMALNLEEDNVGVVLFGDETLVKEGDTVKRTGRVASMPVSDDMLDALSIRSEFRSTAAADSIRQILADRAQGAWRYAALSQ